MLVKIIPPTQDHVATKTIYIAKTDEDGEFIGEYLEYKIEKNTDMKWKGLIPLLDPKKLIANFYDFKDGKKYHVFMYAQDFDGRQRKEANANQEGR